MLTGSGLQDASSPFWGYDHILSPDEWVQRLNDGYTGALKGWIILGGQFQFNPAPSGTVNFPYISKYWARSEEGTPKGEFTADDDTFFLGDRIMKLGLIWRWRQQKGMEYAEDLQTYENTLSQLQLRDGARASCCRAIASTAAMFARPISTGHRYRENPNRQGKAACRTNGAVSCTRGGLDCQPQQGHDQQRAGQAAARCDDP